MKVIRVRNVNDALPQGLELLQKEGIREESRAGPVLVLPYPVTTVYERPQERVLFSPHRDSNPFFTIMEALWMLAGRNDAKWLDQFVGDFGQRFAEPDGRIADSYGFRWRRHFDVEGGGSVYLPNQLETVINLFKKNPKDRQAVISMWDPPSDLGVIGLKTRPCLAGDTILWSPEGDLPIKKIAAKFKRGEIDRWPVYTVHHKHGRGRDSSIIAWATNVWKSGRQGTIRIEFDDGSVINCTKGHQFYKRFGGRLNLIDAGSLKPGDRVQARSRCIDTKGYVHFGEGALAGSQVAAKYSKLLFGPKPAGYAVHHKNECKNDDRAANLIYIQEAEHNKHHRTKWWAAKSEEERLEMGAKFEAGKTIQGRARQAAWASNHMKEEWSKISKEERQQYAAMMAKARWGSQNHVVVSIKPGIVEDVYDFMVPEYHNAIVGTGVVTHNCNTHAYFRIRPEIETPEPFGMAPRVRNVLDITVCCRSNDIIWGAYGTNAVQFSVLQEYMAARIGVGIGTYFQISNNYHAYVDIFEKMKGVLNEPKMGYVYGSSCYMVSNPETFDEDLARFMEWSEGEEPDQDPQNYPNNPWLQETAEPLFVANHFWKQKDREHALEVVQEAEGMAIDWKLAAQAWMQRRINGKPNR